MDRTQQPPANPADPQSRNHAPRPDEDAGKLGRKKAGEGLDTGVDTGAIQPGQSGDASPLN